MMFVNNYFLDLPDDMQDKIFFYIHKSFMSELKEKILIASLKCFLQKHDWLDHHEISKLLSSRSS